MKTGLRWYDSLLILLLFYLLILQTQAIWSFTIDDMFISLRYARHWVEGVGLLWNPNSPPVEGYSNFSFVVLAAASLALKINPIITLKLAGFAGLLITCFFIYLISRFWFSVRQALIPCIALLFYKGQIIWSTSGLETTVYQALVCGAVFFIFQGLGYRFFPKERRTSDVKFLVLSALLLSLAGMTRPEAPVLMIAFFFLIGWDYPESDVKARLWGMFYFGLTILIVYCPYFLWRWHYFGSLVPNSVHCKGFVNNTSELDLSYLKLIWPLAVLAIPVLLKAKDKRHYFLWVPSIVYLALLFGADPVVAFDNRLFLAPFALLLPLSLQGLAILLSYFLDRNRLLFVAPDSAGRALFFSSFLLLLLFMPWMTLGQFRYFTQFPVQGEHLRATVVHWLEQYAKPGEQVVLGDAGFIPYYSNLNFIDSYCLNNLTMGQALKTQRYTHFCQQILKDKPAVIILTSLINQGEKIYTPSDSCLKNLLNNQNDYKLDKVLSVGDVSTAYQYELFRNF